VRAAVWIGGEPLLRKDLVRTGMDMFPFNWLITNGTLPIPKWDDVAVFISVDGTRDYFERTRGPNYDLVRKNALESPVGYRAAMVVNSGNHACIEEFAREWLADPKCMGINYDFYTPSVGENDELALSEEQIESLLDQIEALKAWYGERILLSRKMIELHRVRNRYGVIGKNCLVGKAVSLDPMGRRKEPCVMAGSDCARCGCTIAFFFAALLKHIDLETLKMAADKLIDSKLE
jgi:hypothetical protein